MEPERIDVGKCAGLFLDKMNAGLRGEDGGLPMAPTYLRAEGAIPKNVPVAVIDAGGTNFRRALVTFTDGGYLVEDVFKSLMPGVESPASWDDFTSFCAEALLPLTDRAERVGICFSYYAEMTPERDGRDPRFTKQVRVSGCKGKHICRDVAAQLRLKGVRDGRFVLLNDTAAVLLGVSALLDKGLYDGFVGLVAGTGVNTCCSLPAARIPKLGGAAADSMLINLESGYMTALPRGEADERVDAGSIDPGRCLYEKMTSGAYLGEVVRQTLLLAADEGLISDGIRALPHADASLADRWCAGDIDAAIADTPGEREFIKSVSCLLFDRAASCVAANLAALLLLTGEGMEGPACICAEGSLFLRSRRFRPALEEQMARYVGGVLGRKYEFHSAEDTTLLGSAAAALLNT